MIKINTNDLAVNAGIRMFLERGGMIRHGINVVAMTDEAADKLFTAIFDNFGKQREVLLEGINLD